MNIFGIGGAELVLVILIMIVVAGPKRMARWAFVLGQYMGKLREMWAQVAETLQQEVDAAGLDVEIPKDVPTRQSIARMTSQALKPYVEPLEKVGKDIERDLAQVKTDVAQVKTAATLPSTAKTPTAASANGSAPKAAPPAKPAADTNNTNSLGTWGNASNGDSKGSDLGSWSKPNN